MDLGLTARGCGSNNAWKRQAITSHWDESHPKAPCYWDEIIPMDGGWLRHWHEALDESVGIIEAGSFEI